jgi:hypothetical protein
LALCIWATFENRRKIVSIIIIGHGHESQIPLPRQDGKALIGKRPMTEVGRAREKGETDGFMKILVDAETKK